MFNYNGEIAVEQSENLTHENGISNNYEPADSRALGQLHLQLNKFIDETKPHCKTELERVKETFRNIKRIIKNIPAHDKLPIRDAIQKLNNDHNTAFPLPKMWSDDEGEDIVLAYAKPAEVKVTGSFLLKTAISFGRLQTIDIVITMPVELFENSDYFDYRYLYRKAYYVACIAASLKPELNDKFKFEYDYQNGNDLQPVLLMSPIQDVYGNSFPVSNFRFRLLTGLQSDLFSIEQTLPWKSCLYVKMKSQIDAVSENAVTPFYNASLRADSLIGVYQDILHFTSLECNGFSKACVMATVWLRQRGFGTEIQNGGFGSFEAAVIIALLTPGDATDGRPLLCVNYGSFHIFENLLRFLALRDLSDQPLVIGGHVPDARTKFGKEIPTFFDAVRGLNLLFKMTSWSYQKLRHDAITTIEGLQSPFFSACGYALIAKANDPLLHYDSLVKIATPKSWQIFCKGLTEPNMAHKFCQKIYSLLSAGLSDRAVMIYPKTPVFDPWSTDSSSFPNRNVPEIMIGLRLDASSCHRIVDRGPSTEAVIAAKAYREFWGEKAELRRFKDGSMVESVVWTDERQNQEIWQLIVTHVIRYHLGDDIANGVKFLGDNFRCLLPGYGAGGPLHVPPFQQVYSTFETFKKQLRELKGLPLQIRQVSASCSDLRSTTITLHTHTINAGRPMDVTIQFEGSTRWPNDLSSNQRTKISLLFQIGNLLEKSVPGTVTRLGLEDETNIQLNSAFLDIISAKTAVFRIRIHYDQEIVLLGSQLKTKISYSSSTHENAPAISTFQRIFVRSPSHTQAIRTLCTRLPCLSPAIRLLKYWLSTHLLSTHISDEFTELLMSRTFIHPHPWAVPGNICSAFLRTLLFIAAWDWRSQPLIVDLNGAMTPTDVDEIKTRFKAWRRVDPAMKCTAIFAASNLDPGGTTWTETRPTKIVAARLTSLAQVTWRTVRQQKLNLDVKTLFSSSLVKYDFIIHLDLRMKITNSAKGGSPLLYAKLQTGLNNLKLIKYDIRRLFFEELTRLYTPNMVLFFSTDRQTVIAGMWNPQTGTRSWKANINYPTAPTSDRIDNTNCDICINKRAVLNDIARLGGGIVARVEPNSQRL